MGAQSLGERRSNPDLSVHPANYFGRDPSELKNADAFGIEPAPEKDLYRVQYLYLMVFGSDRPRIEASEASDKDGFGDEASDYGGIQVRASTHLYLEDGRVPIKLQRVIQRTAHRGAFLFDSGIEHPVYGGGGGEWGGGGYLSGFTPVENNSEYANWEIEPVGSAEGRPAGSQPGVIRWTTEIYLEVEGTQYADLSGVAQGIGDPYQLVEHDVPPEEPVEAQQEWWQFSENFNNARNAYQIAPPAYSAGRERGKKLRGKTVHINGLPIGEVDKEGRVWLKKEYQGGNTYRGDYSREGVLETTPATPQSLALGRKIAKVDESPGAVYLATASARPDDFDPVDPGEVEIEREVQPGSPGGRIYLLSLPEDVEDPTRQECRQDEEKISHLGYSDPPYAHTYAEMWRWPGFRPVAEYGWIETPADRREDGQTGLDEHDGGSDE